MATGVSPVTHLETPMPAASVTAEQSALGSILGAAAAGRDARLLAEDVFAIATPPMFWRPGHQALAELLHAMACEGVPIDPQTVMARLTESGELSRIGGAPYLHTLWERAWVINHATAYAAEVRECYTRRLMQQAGTRLVQQAASPETELGLLMTELGKTLDEAAALAEIGPPPLPATLAELLEGVDNPDWLVEGLLERGERVMVTGHEGLGKTMLLAQLAVCIAAGLHPFTGQVATPRRVLVVDCENPRGQLRRRYRHMALVADGILAMQKRTWDHTNLMIEVREEGLDLTGGDDVAWLDRLLRGAQADVLITGPLYKLHRANINDEQAARHLTHTLDLLRTRHRVALILEAHAGQSEDAAGRRKLRPRGSALFLGWPSIGIGLRPHRDDNGNGHLIEVRPWRGAREDRAWPQVLERGTGYGLPWQPNYSAMPSTT